MKIYLISYVIILCLKCFVICGRLREEFTWTRISYDTTQSSYPGSYKKSPNAPSYHSSYYNISYGNDKLYFPQDDQPSSTENNESYIYQNNIPMGANLWKNKLFITVPRRRLGIPSTLNYVPLNSVSRHNVPLIPYPDLKTNAMIAPPGQEHLISVYRVAVDPCDRLWMVDTGIIEVPGNRTVLGPHKLVIIDLNTDRIIKTYNFKDSDLGCRTTLSLVTVDVTARTCDDAYAYFPDLASYGLVVYSLKKHDSWRIRHNYFFLEPQGGELNIVGVKFQWSDGIFSGGLTDLQNDGHRTYIFHPMAGTHLYAVSTKILKNKLLATRSYHENDFKVLGDRGRYSQTSASDLHQQSGILFLGLINQNAVGCWNTKKIFHLNNFDIVQKNNVTMIYPSDVKIASNNLIVLTNSMPLFIFSQLDYDKINFRVWISNVYDAVAGTSCEDRRLSRY